MAEDRNDTIGALLIATLITAVGYGVTSMQTYQWYRAFPHDPRIIRWVVSSVCVLDTLHIILIMHMIYYYLVTNYDNPDALAESVWSWDLIDKLTYWTVNNGLLTSVVGLAVIITFVTMPYNMIYMALHPLLSKLYANSLLATLNFRSIHRDEVSRDVDAANDAGKFQVGMGHVRSRSTTVCSCRGGPDLESSPTDTKAGSGKDDEQHAAKEGTRTTVRSVRVESYEGKADSNESVSQTASEV
ncbi:uncharacterized protein B0H18DRAFT_1209996 [Fomitopsis serialis]|uniref:uncharacterized protein n=1 Tax=Fomitopsis serialis TaxID=139415 RepID=UPI0020082246|nr:uncharacterized protein B0H18DRAFT_1209996 [Neoantrodia serialis]KAH9929264.1 hypothetical protein B0H18DRAFT_1209996 [Neoantrodia serialis]